MLVCYGEYVNEKNNLGYYGFWTCWADLWKCGRANLEGVYLEKASPKKVFKKTL